jgi:hypothetical protein
MNKMVKYLLGILIVTGSFLINSWGFCSTFSDIINNASMMNQTPPLIYNQDISWQHNAITIPLNCQIISAQLIISAYDVDTNTTQTYTIPEVDNVYVYDNGIRKYLGKLIGRSDNWDYTTFNLDPIFFDDIINGLRVEIDVDALSSSNNWSVTIGSSEVKGNYVSVPLPGTLVMLSSGILIVIGIGRCFPRQ